MKKLFLLFSVGMAGLFSCEKNHDKSGIFKGPDAEVYHGKAWTWVQLDRDGNPLRVAISVDTAALNSVEIGGEEGGTTGGHTHENNYVLNFHPKASVTPFKHAWLNWNPAGHPPPGIYDAPHFDMHFYMTSTEERETYLDPVKLDAPPGADYLPVNHLGVDPIPTMGKHFVDLASPELNGQPFTQTFIYGTYDSKVVFYEPMITLEFLKNTDNFVRAIPQPLKFQKSGFYPTKMRVVKEKGVSNIILEDFIYRQQS